MNPSLLSKFKRSGGLSFMAGLAIAAYFLPLTNFPTLRGPQTVPFLAYYALAGGAYVLAVARLKHDKMPLKIIWAFAILFRLILLFTPPTLSDDVYRYLWDGNLFTRGVNPYALPVNSPHLNAYHIPARDMVNHDWMASPYLPAAQAYYAVVAWIAPGSVKAFQAAAVMLDLGAGWLVMSILSRIKIPPQVALIYLWNPLVIVEFAHSAHVDVLMIFLMTLGLYYLVSSPAGGRPQGRNVYLSALSLAAATLTKVIPILLTPLFLRRWRWRGYVLFGMILAGALGIFAAGAGWGLTGPMDGSGLFGALRIYQSYWNYNGGLYHWLEVWLSGYPAGGAVPPEIIGENTLRLLRAAFTAATALISLGVGLLVWKRGVSSPQDPSTSNRSLLRLTIIPLGVFLLLSHTVHPWYVTVILPVLPFLVSAPGEKDSAERLLWPWIYFSLAIGLSYLTYIDPDNPREFAIVRWIEYIPLYGLLLWAAWPYLLKIKKAPHGGHWLNLN